MGREKNKLPPPPRGTECKDEPSPNTDVLGLCLSDLTPLGDGCCETHFPGGEHGAQRSEADLNLGLCYSDGSGEEDGAWEGVPIREVHSGKMSQRF